MSKLEAEGRRPQDSRRRAVIIHLGRTNGMGAMRRVRGLASIFENAGYLVEDIALRTDFKSGPRDLTPSRLANVRAGRIVPESLSWSLSAVLDVLDALDPDVLVCETARAFDPALAARWKVILDYVDRLSVSYRDRASLSTSLIGRTIFEQLGSKMARFEMSNTPDLHSRIAVGYADAKALCAEWVPITVEASAANIWEPPGLVYDLVFFGSLEYLPNIEALEYIANIWPIVKSERPATTLLVAGARPTERVKAMVSRCGWSMWEDFDDIGEMLSHARLSLVPLRHASGMQTKVLDAASHGIPQVVSAVGLAGFSPGFPARVADSESEFIEAILSLLESRDELLVLGEASKAHVLTEYSVERWVDWADRLSL